MRPNRFTLCTRLRYSGIFVSWRRSTFVLCIVVYSVSRFVCTLPKLRTNDETLCPWVRVTGFYPEFFDLCQESTIGRSLPLRVMMFEFLHRRWLSHLLKLFTKKGLGGLLPVRLVVILKPDHFRSYFFVELGWTSDGLTLYNLNNKIYRFEHI